MTSASGFNSSESQTNTSIILDAYSPLIVYDSSIGNNTWSVGVADRDSYNNGTFMFSDQKNARATLQFTGTGLKIVGSYTANGGPYMITIDGEDQPINRTGIPPDSNDQLFNYVMFDNRETMPHGLHTVVLTNEAEETDGQSSNAHVDVDYMMFSTSLPSTIADAIIQDTEFTYGPVDAWDANSTNFPDFNGGTVHHTSSENATASLTFQGTRIVVYGAVGDAGAPYTVQVDGGELFLYNGTRPGLGYRSGEILCYMDNLANTTHEITLMAIPVWADSVPVSSQSPVAGNSSLVSRAAAAEKPGVTFSVDYAIVDGHTTTTINNANTDSAISHAVLAGIVVGSVVASALICLAIYWLVRRSRLRNPASSNNERPKEKDRLQSLENTGIHMEVLNANPVFEISLSGPTSPLPLSPTLMDEKRRSDYSLTETVEGYPVERERLMKIVAAREAGAGHIGSISEVVD